MELGLVASLARPGGNITGLTSLAFELSAKRLELLKEALPKLARVAVLYGRHPRIAPTLKDLEVAARTLGIQLQPLEVRGPEDLERAFDEMAKGRAGALLMLPGPGFNEPRLADLALGRRLPAIWLGRDYVRAGGLLAYGASRVDMARRAATFVDKILKGAKPADLPVEQPTKFELVINRASRES